jgi:phage protein D
MPERSYQLFFDDAAADQTFYANVIEVQAEDCAGEAGTFRVRVAIRPDEAGEWTSVEDDAFALFTKVRIEAGFHDGNTEVLTEGYITEVRLRFEDPGRSPYLEISGLDDSIAMSLEEKIVSWPNLADSDIATQVLSAYGFVPDVTRTDPVHQENDVTVLQRGTDLQFLRRLAAKNGFEVGVEKDFVSGTVTGYFRPPDLDGSPQKPLAVAFGPASSLDWFEVTTDGLKPLAIEASQIDVKAKAANSGTGTALQLTAIGSRDLSALVQGPIQSIASPREAAGKLWLHTTPTSDTTELTAIAQAVRDAAGWLSTARGEINSDVYATVLRARRLVTVKGAGAQHSGKYYVTRVTHRIGADGRYRQTFDASRNAVGLDGSEDFEGGLALSF